jgi:hypothetical protein
MMMSMESIGKAGDEREKVYDVDDGEILQVPEMREYLDAEGVGAAQAVPELSPSEVGHPIAVGRREIRRQEAGCVYFIETHDRAFVKIGFSTYMYARLNTIKCNCPGARLIGYMPGTRATEESLHLKFAAVRGDGEWFTNTEELRAFIQTLELTTTLNPPKSRGPRTSEERTAIAIKINANRTPEERRACTENAREAMAGKRRNIVRPSEEEKEAAKKIRDAITLEKRRANQAKFAASLTPEQRSAISKKGHKNRVWSIEDRGRVRDRFAAARAKAAKCRQEERENFSPRQIDSQFSTSG